MSGKNKNMIFDPIRKKKIIKDLVIYIIVISCFLAIFIDVDFRYDSIKIDDLLKISGKVTHIEKVISPLGVRPVCFRFEINDEEYDFYYYSYTYGFKDTFEKIKDENTVTLTVKQKNHLFKRDYQKDMEILDIRSNEKIYYDINDTNKIRLIERIGLKLFLMMFVIFYTVMLWFRHTTDIDIVRRAIRRRKK